MIIILSAINGLEGLVDQMSSKFDSDLRITSREGKSFDREKFPAQQIRQLPGVEAASEVIEELCIVKYGDRFVHAMMKGVEDDFFRVSRIAENLEDGDTLIRESEFYFAMADVSLAAALELYLSDRPGEYESITLYSPIRNKKFKVNSDPFNKQTLFLSAVFTVNSDDELKPLLVHRDLAAALLEYEQSISAFELRVNEAYEVTALKAEIEKLLGESYRVQTRYEQNELLYRVSQSEKFFVLAMLSFVLLLTSFNILASLTMLVIDKKNDITILRSLGADRSMIRSIFFGEGMLINFFGAFAGLTLGATVVLLQYFFHLIPLEGAVINYYPVQLKAIDFIWVFLIVSLVGTFCSYIPVRYLVRKHFH